jgi:DNA-binding NtrC family response regulator
MLRNAATVGLDGLPSSAVDWSGSAVEEFVAADVSTRTVLHRANELATTCSRFLVTGEAGTGKLTLARNIHRCSEAAELQVMDCGNTNCNLEGLLSDSIPRWLFLKNIDRLPLDSQAKLSDLLQECSNVRVIAMSIRSLETQVKLRNFDKLLYEHLRTVHFELASMRERPQDTMALSERFLQRACALHQRNVTITPNALEALSGLYFRTNFAGLYRLMMQTVADMRDDSIVTEEMVGFSLASVLEPLTLAPTWKGCSYDAELSLFERRLIRRALEAAAGSITKAARLLEMSHQRLMNIINSKHPELLGLRIPVRSRPKGDLVSLQ